VEEEAEPAKTSNPASALRWDSPVVATGTLRLHPDPWMLLEQADSQSQHSRIPWEGTRPTPAAGAGQAAPVSASLECRASMAEVVGLASPQSSHLAPSHDQPLRKVPESKEERSSLRSRTM
jgi:hypothetical protein